MVNLPQQLNLPPGQPQPPALPPQIDPLLLQPQPQPPPADPPQPPLDPNPPPAPQLPPAPQPEQPPHPNGVQVPLPEPVPELAASPAAVERARLLAIAASANSDIMQVKKLPDIVPGFHASVLSLGS
ncbi:hypothetical protein PYCCODRAFT_930581 [Trametes coccinea BRFM310]|uniref:Uncharacterized protein n=1 Tax=Trametes coccinea (strain BRFM310) TaxID=1353009 RepID=A0A1Y2IZ27_TRAC3|nr:hypothetical protein PYCCODRAFT_930581 [Trametes coccinea BRFM310]